MATVTAPPQPQIIMPPPSVIIPDTADGFNFQIGRRPEALIADAQICAVALLAAVKRNGWVKQFNGRDHLYYEAWSFVARMFRVTAQITKTNPIRIDDYVGFEAFAEALYIPSKNATEGIVICKADSMCLNDEDNWDERPVYEYPNNVKTQVGNKKVPLFQIRSMAQTRACSRVLKLLFSWVVAMAGYAPVSVEEMMMNGAMPEGNQGGAQTPAASQQMPKEKSPANPEELISDKQVSRIWGIAYSLYPNNRKGANDAVYGALRQFGFEQPGQVTVAKYEDLIKAIQQPKGGNTTTQ